MIRTPATLALCTLALVTACNGEAEPLPEGGLSVLATDAPIDPSVVTDARIWVDQVLIHKDAGATSGFRTVYEGAPVELDLDDLRAGLTTQLADVVLPAGTYSQLLVRISSASLEVAGTTTFTTGDATLSLVGQNPNGYQVLLEPPVEVVNGLDRSLILDFDLSKSFRPLPAGDPLVATGFELEPVVRTGVLEVTGILGGSVTDFATSLPVPGATLYLLPPGETDTAESLGTTATIANGTYALLGVQAGTYDIFGVSGALEDRVDGVQVVDGILNLADLALE